MNTNIRWKIRQTISNSKSQRNRKQLQRKHQIIAVPTTDATAMEQNALVPETHHNRHFIPLLIVPFKRIDFYSHSFKNLYKNHWHFLISHKIHLKSKSSNSNWHGVRNLSEWSARFMRGRPTDACAVHARPASTALDNMVGYFQMRLSDVWLNTVIQTVASMVIIKFI